MSLFQELNADPAEVVGLFPALVPEDLRAQFNYPIKISKLGAGRRWRRGRRARLG